MRKKVLLLCLAALCVLCLSACGCKHETWQEADCVTAKTCAECGETEGEPLGHDWLEADCLTAKTCTRCSGTEGSALGHDWTPADCENPEICTRCAEIQGEPLGHSWLEATTEAPETCEGCGLTQGSRIVTDHRFKTENCKHLFGKWEATVNLPTENIGMAMEGLPESIEVMYCFDFHNDGDLLLTVKPLDMDAIADMMKTIAVETMYVQLEQAGISRKEADQAVLAQYGMTIEKLMEAQLAEIDLNELFSSMCKTYVYYVEGDQFYMGADWDELEGKTYSCENDTLTIPVDDFGDVVFTRVVEEEADSAA